MLRASAVAGPAIAVLLFGSVALAMSVGWGSAVEASFEAQTGVPELLPQESEPESDDGPEANLPYLFAVFIITWAVFFGYVFVMSRRQNELRQEIDALKLRLAESEGAAQTRAD